MSLEKNRSLVIIVNAIQNSTKALNRQELLSVLLENDTDINMRSLDRYIKELKSLFFISYNYTDKGYEINKLINASELDMFLSLIHKNINNQSLLDSMKDGIEIQKFILTERAKFEGIENLDILIKAIKNQKQIQFKYYKKFKEVSFRIVYPRLLKEYENRWYLIGEDETKNRELRIFGLDRIKNIKELRGNKHVEDIDYSYIFEQIIGVNTAEFKKYDAPVSVVFQANDNQIHYIKALPIHKSQVLLYEDETSARFKIEVYPNYELKQQFFKYTPFVKILEPKWLRIEMISDLKWMLNEYE